LIIVSKGYQKSNKIFNDNIRWLLNSDIRIKRGKNMIYKKLDV